MALKKVKVSDQNGLKKGDYIIGSLSKGTVPLTSNKVSISDDPMVHTSLTEAKTEAERLAAIDRTKRFVVMKVEGVVTTDGIKWE